MTSSSVPSVQRARRGRPPRSTIAPLLTQEGTAKTADANLEQNKQEVAATKEDSRAFPAPTETSERLFQDNMRLALMIARKWAARTKMPFDNFKTFAYIGLLRATRKYNPSLINPKTQTPYKLSTFAIPVIETEIKHMLRRNHTSGVRFPDSWRDHAPKIRRLAGEGLTHEQISKETGFEQDEIREILQAQSYTKEINLDAMGHAHYDSDIIDESIDSEECINALRIADEAWMGLDWSEQQLIVRCWQGNGRPGREEIAQRPFNRFIKYATAIATGHSLPRGVRQPLLDLEILNDDGDIKHIEKCAEIISALEQMALNLD